MADVQTRFFYPPDVILRAVPLISALNYGYVFHLWLAGAGTYALCRQIETSRWPAMIAAIGFALGGAFSPRLYPVHTVLIYSVAWLPLIMALCLRSIESRRWAPLPWLPVVLAIQVLAGYMQGSIYVVSAVVALYAFQALRRWQSGNISASWHLLAQLCLVAVVSAGLTAVQLLQTAQLVVEAGRARGISYETAARDSLSWAHLTTLAFPSAIASRATEFRESVPGGMWEKSGYVGLVLLIAAPLSLMFRPSRSKALFWAALALVALGFALGRNLPLYEIHHALMPGLRNPGRLLPFWSLGIAVMGALGLDRFLLYTSRGVRPGIATIWLAIITSGALAAGILTYWPRSDASALADRALLGTSGWLLILVGGAFTLTLLPSAPWRRLLIPMALSGVTVLDLVPFASQFIVLGRPPHHEELEVALHRLQPARVLTLCGEDVAENDMMHIGVAGIDGYNGIFLNDYARFSSLANGQRVPASYTQFPSIGGNGVPSRMDLVDLLNTSHVLSCRPLTGDRFEQVDRIQRVRIYANRRALERAYWTCDVRFVSDQEEALALVADPMIDLSRTTVVVDTQYRANLGWAPHGCLENAAVSVLDMDRPDGLVRVTTGSPTSGMLFLSEPFYPERKATVDGHETAVLRANIAFSAIPLGPGTHTVELRYVPTALYAGAAISALTAGIWLVVSMRSFIHR